MTTHPCAVAYGWRREAAGCRPQRLPWNASPRILRVLDSSAPLSVSATKSGPNTACVVIFRSVNQPWNQLKSHNHNLINMSRVGRGPQRSENHSMHDCAFYWMISVSELPQPPGKVAESSHRFVIPYHWRSAASPGLDCNNCKRPSGHLSRALVACPRSQCSSNVSGSS